MPTIQIKNVPDETHRVLRMRAADAHQSLQEYLLAHLIEEATRPSVNEVIDRIESRRDGIDVDFADVVALVREDRDSR